MKNLLLIVVASSFVAIGGSTLAQAQVVDTVAADIPFGFMVRGTTLPAGEYTIRRLASVNPSVMEIRSADGKETLFFFVESVQANMESDQTKLIFDRVGDRYFLSEIFEVGDRSGVELEKSRDEREIEKEGEIGLRHTVAIPVRTGINASR